MFNRQTIDFLKIINNFTDTVILNYPTTIGNSTDKDIVFKADLSSLDNEGFEGDLGIFKLNSFLNIFNLFDAYNIKVENSSINITDGNTTVNYILTNPLSLTAFNAVNPDQFKVLQNIPSVLEFTLSVNDLKKFKTASSSFSELNTVIIEGGDNPNISLIQTESSEQMTSNSVKINIADIANKDFKIGINIQTLLSLPVTDYTVMVKYNESKDKYRLYVKPVNNDTLELILPVKSNI